MLPLDVVTAVAVVVGGTCLFDVLRRLRRPHGIVPPRDWVVNLEASSLSLCVSILLMDVMAHWLAAHGMTPPVNPFAGPT